MVVGFRPDEHVWTICFDLSPDHGGGLLRESSQVHQRAFRCHFRKRSSVRLANGDEFSSFEDHSPGARALATIAAELSMRFEVVHVDVGARVCLACITYDSLRFAVDALNPRCRLLLVISAELCAIVFASFSVVSPGSLAPSASD